MAADMSRPSCYLLEFSVAPGGARQGDVYANGTLAGLRKDFKDENVDSHLVLAYGAVLHAWSVQHGVLVDGFDLHPFLRTGNDEWDRTLLRLVEMRRGGRDARTHTRWDDVERFIEGFEFDSAKSLPALTEVFRRCDEGDARPLGRLAEISQNALPSAPPVSLSLDWPAIAQHLPELKPPILTKGWFELTLAPGVRKSAQGSYLSRGTELHEGWNDLEGGYDEYEG